jgi:hypothetical protein
MVLAAKPSDSLTLLTNLPNCLVSRFADVAIFLGLRNKKFDSSSACSTSIRPFPQPSPLFFLFLRTIAIPLISPSAFIALPVSAQTVLCNFWPSHILHSTISSSNFRIPLVLVGSTGRRVADDDFDGEGNFSAFLEAD